MSYVEISSPRPHVAQITLNRPERLNALSFDTVVPLHAALERIAADHETWAVVLTGAGAGFCSGLDLEDHGVPPGISGLPMSRIAIRAMALFADLVPRMRALPQPILAASPSAPTSGWPAARRASAAPACATGSPTRSSASRGCCPA
jgi:enoyl-CoA hydratase